MTLQPSRDCPLLPNTQLQCPYAKPGKQCTAATNHGNYSGQNKVVFRGLTGHAALIQHVYELMKEMFPDLQNKPVQSKSVCERVVTAIWRDRDDGKQEEADMVKKISSIDPEGTIFPRFIFHATVTNADKAVREEYLRIKDQLSGYAGTRPQFFTYRKMLERQFEPRAEVGGHVKQGKKLNIMFQEFGGAPIYRFINQVMMQAREQGRTLQVKASILQGLLDMFLKRSSVLHANGIAHMDIHSGNVVAIELPPNPGSSLSRYRFRMIDFGDHEKPISVLIHGLRDHDPIEYDLMNCALEAMHSLAHRPEYEKLMTRRGGHWELKKPHSADDGSPCMLLEDYDRMDKNYDFIFKGISLTWCDLYEYIYNVTKNICVSSQDSLKDHRSARTEILSDFQNAVYGSNAEEARMLWDHYAFARVSIKTAYRIDFRWNSSELEEKVMRDFVFSQQKFIFDRFQGFPAEPLQPSEVFYLGSCSDGTLNCFARGQLVKIVNRALELVFAGRLPFEPLAGWFSPVSFHLFLQKSNNVMVLDYGEKRYRVATKQELNQFKIIWQPAEPSSQQVQIESSSLLPIRRLMRKKQDKEYLQGDT